MTVSPGPARPSWAAVWRCQVRPSREVHRTAWVAPWPAGARPAARKPCAVLFSTHIWSPGSCGVMPWVAARVQVVPSGLVQMACGPTASQPPGPPASRAAGYPSGGCPPPGSPHRRQPPARPAIGRHEELLPHHPVTELRTHRHDGRPGGHDPADGLEHPTLLLTGIHADGQRGLRGGALGAALADGLVGRELAELRAVAGQQGEGQDGHRDQHEDRHRDGRGAPADRAEAGALVPGRPAVRARAAACHSGWPGGRATAPVPASGPWPGCWLGHRPGTRPGSRRRRAPRAGSAAGCGARRAGARRAPGRGSAPEPAAGTGRPPGGAPTGFRTLSTGGGRSAKGTGWPSASWSGRPGAWGGTQDLPGGRAGHASRRPPARRAGWPLDSRRPGPGDR